MCEIEDLWNKLIDKCSKNPIFLFEFVRQYMEFNGSKEWTPLVLVVSIDDMIVGVAPLITKREFGVRFVRFLFKSWLSPDFIVEDQYREICIGHILNFLFRTLQCQFVELTLPAESRNIRILKQKCKAFGIHFCTRSAMGHYIIPVDCTWDEFVASRGKYFAQRFRRMERHLDRAGSWRFICVENKDAGLDVFQQILDVESRSWKEAWRTQRGVKIDPDLLIIWKGSHNTATTQPDFKWSVWFLELNDRPLAYTLVLQYKGVAFFMKTSYDERHKRCSPGMYVLNAAIRGLFNKREVRNIDFLTDLPFERTWASLCLPRVRVMMSRKGISSIIMRANSKLVEFLRVVRPRQLEGKVFF